MADETPIQESAPAQAAPVSPGSRLWNRYLKAKGAKTGLVLISLFALVAFFAPFLAHRLPFYWHDYETGATSYPLFRDFFAPSDTTEGLLEKGINFLLLFIPIALVAWKLMNRFAPRLAKMESRLIALLFGAVFSAALWVAIGGMVVQGGGSDWFHYENPPVPETDDMKAPAIIKTGPPSSPGGAKARRTVAAKLSALGLEADAVDDPDSDAGRRAILIPVQDAIDGPALAPVSEFSGLAGIDPLDITDANLGIGINAARWNRILVEAAYPEMLTPVRQFRGTFLALAFASLLALLGLTYIFMAGANQFALSPRWLVLIALGFVVSIPFQAKPMNDQTAYRQRFTEGKGYGVFPLVPYGPNEQGFGPRLPPFWWDEPATLTPDDILSWRSLVGSLERPELPGAKRIARLLDEAKPDWRALADNDEGRAAMAGVLNTIIDTPGLYTPEAFANLRIDLSLAPYMRAIQSGAGLDGLHAKRFNRLLVERATQSSLAPAAAIRWKKPNHAEGWHLLGTDESGRDVLVRIIHGARVSLSVGFVSVFLATVIGLVLGSLAAYYAGWVDLLISRFMEVMMCFPSFFLILAVIAVLDRRSIVNIMLVIGLTSWTGVARLIRGEMLRQKKMDYVSASIALGAPDTRTIFRHILPNAMAPVLVSISFGITGAILTEAGLSFIGFGVTPPTPTWGQLLSETRESPLANWWLAVFPGIVLFFGVLAYNMVGEALRDALDPRTSL